jgi:putative spermidine/putrescine transport system permease protein
MHRALPCYVVLACLLLMAPIVIVVILAFSGEGYLQFPPTSFSLRWFARFLADPQWQAALWYSLVIGVIACVIATVLGFFAAYAFVRSDLAGKKLLLSLLLLPIIVPTVITSIAMYFLSARLHLVGNLLWIGTCHAVIALPVVLLILLAALQGVDVNLERAALNLGASPARLLLRVVVPLAAPGLISAALFAFLASFDELIISLFLTGVQAQTLPVRIWNSLHLEIEPTIAAVSAFLIGITALVLLLDALLRGRRAATMAAKRQGDGR